MSRFLVVLALVSGCSVALQKKPKQAECSTTSAYWIADLAIAAAVAVSSVAYAELGSDESDIPNTVGGVGLFTGLAFGISADSGHRWARECLANRDRAVASRL